MNNSYLTATGVYYKGTLEKIEKSKEYLQPIYEALTNSLESIKEKSNDIKNEKIIITINHGKNLTSRDTQEYDFTNIVIEDSGLGFNEVEFERFRNLNDNKKGYYNNGTGRVQFLHFFNECIFETICSDTNSKTGNFQKKFILSKSEKFLSQNAIIYLDSIEEVFQNDTYTKITFTGLLDEKDEKNYQKLSLDLLKDKIIEHYLDYFCENRNSIPQIILKYYLDNVLEKELKIESNDIPILDKEEKVVVAYSKFSADGKKIEKIEKSEEFKLKSYRISDEYLDSNSLKLTSKGEIVKGSIAKKFKLNILKPEDSIDDHRYLFLISGNYLNEKDTDTRGNLDIPTKEEFKKLNKDEAILDLYEEIILDDLEEEVNNKILSMYDDISEKIDNHKMEIEKLKKMFLLNEKTIESINIKLQDTENTILKKIYKADSEIIATKDIEIKNQIENLEKLDTSSKNYDEEFNKQISELVKIIPQQNRTALTHYVARRKLVLDLFQKILDRELLIQKHTQRNIDEKLLHNLIFQQSSDNPEESDLWLINEDFVYFKGTSESKLGDIQLNGEYIFKNENELTEQEIEFKNSLGENRYAKKPDILLFPDEGKCIIIEFKNPDVNVSSQLQQIDNYASLIWNFTQEKYKFHTFYGYFVGEKINNFDVRSHDSNYIESYQFDYLFRPSKNVAGLFVKGDANIYSEVIKYSTLLKRAKSRNNIFIKKLIDSKN